MSILTHEAVMTEEVLENLVHSRKGFYVDCTFGAGGHSSRILEELNKDGRLLSMTDDLCASLKSLREGPIIDNYNFNQISSQSTIIR